MVPEWGTETRIVNATEYRTESRDRTITVNRQVAETQQRTQTYTVMVPQTRTRTVSYTVSKPVYETQSVNYTVNVPVWNDVAKEYTVQVPYTENIERSYTVSVPVWSDVEKSYTVMVPHTETRQATRTVCRRVAETSTRTVTRDQGHWETQMVEVACNGGSSSYGGCGSGCGQLRRLWIRLRRLWSRGGSGCGDSLTGYADCVPPDVGAQCRYRRGARDHLSQCHRAGSLRLHRDRFPPRRAHTNCSGLQLSHRGTHQVCPCDSLSQRNAHSECASVQLPGSNTYAAIPDLPLRAGTTGSGSAIHGERPRRAAADVQRDRVSDGAGREDDHRDGERARAGSERGASPRLPHGSQNC